MNTSTPGIAFIDSFEKFSATVYKDAAGYPSIGYGHRLQPDEEFPDSIDENEAEQLMHCDLACAEEAVNDMECGLSQTQFDALVSLAYNIGTGAFSSSTLVKLLNADNLDAAAQQFLVWCHIKTPTGVEIVSEGLLARRQAEQTLFLTGVYNNH